VIHRGRVIEAAPEDVLVPGTTQDSHKQSPAAPADEIVGAAQHGVLSMITTMEPYRDRLKGATSGSP
jgi:hypothetical protein